MALEGQLSDFRLEEILQLIAVQQKSGFLVLKQDEELVFYFDRGVLVSTRDRRGPGNDPLERYLRRYGFFTAEQWQHLDYVLRHASLDLAEVVVSENLMDERALRAVLQALAQELIHEGMKLKRGSYHFTAAADVTTGIRGRIDLDIQGLLMEGARRQDEEPRLLEKLPSTGITFERGPKPPLATELGETGARLLRQALAGRTLGEIIETARTGAFTTRELLARLCDAGTLVPRQPELGRVIPLPTDRAAAARPRQPLRSPALATALALLLVAGAAWRWRPLLAGAPPASAAAVATATSPRTPAVVREAQLQDDLEQGLVLFRLQHARYPGDLGQLVAEGFVTAGVATTLERAGWRYQVTEQGRSYALAR